MCGPIASVCMVQHPVAVPTIVALSYPLGWLPLSHAILVCGARTGCPHNAVRESATTVANARGGRVCSKLPRARDGE